MLARFKPVLILALFLAIPALALAAASPDKAEKVAAKMLNFDKALTAAQTQIDTTLGAMNALSNPEGDLTAKYKTFSKEVDNLQKAADKAKSNSEAATSQREAYLSQWQASQEKIQNPQLKAASEARRAELAPKIEAVKTSLTSAKDTFGPFMQDLRDLTVFLGTQLNPGGIQAASELMSKCNASGEKVKGDIAAGQESLRHLASSIAPGGGTPTK